MEEFFNSLWHIMLNERSWSWTIGGIVYLILSMVVQSFFFRDLLKRAKSLHSKWYHDIRKAYLKRSIAGWVLFLLSFLLFILFWETSSLKTIEPMDIAILFGVLIFLVFSIMSHLIAFSVALIQSLKKLENNQMTL